MIVGKFYWARQDSTNIFTENLFANQNDQLTPKLADDVSFQNILPTCRSIGFETVDCSGLVQMAGESVEMFVCSVMVIFFF